MQTMKLEQYNVLIKLEKYATIEKFYFLVDACQSFGRLDIDVKKMKIDLLAASAHKIHGPQGIGLLYVNRKKSYDAVKDAN